MKLRLLLVGMIFLSQHLLGNEPLIPPSELDEESIDVAEMLINLAPSIVRDLNPPVIGAERKITNATVTENASSRVYFIEGEDVYRDGRVLSTFWLRLSKRTSIKEIWMGSGIMPLEGRPLTLPTKELIGSLLNGIYDIKEMSLDHRRVQIDRLQKTNIEPLTFEIFGENQICLHRDLNLFRITITRQVDARNNTTYATTILHPFNEG